jgi:hypothetical protein
VAVYFFDFFRARGASGIEAGTLSGLTGFAVIGMGALGCVLAGYWADRPGLHARSPRPRRQRVQSGSRSSPQRCQEDPYERTWRIR